MPQLWSSLQTLQPFLLTLPHTSTLSSGVHFKVNGYFAFYSIFTLFSPAATSGVTFRCNWLSIIKTTCDLQSCFKALQWARFDCKGSYLQKVTLERQLSSFCRKTHLHILLSQEALHSLYFFQHIYGAPQRRATYSDLILSGRS